MWLEVLILNDLRSPIEEARCKSLVTCTKSVLPSGNLCALQSSAEVPDVSDSPKAARMSISKSVSEMREFVSSMAAADTQDMQGVQHALDQVQALSLLLYPIAPSAPSPLSPATLRLCTLNLHPPPCATPSWRRRRRPWARSSPRGSTS